MTIRPEPWAADLAALRVHTSQDVPSIERTEELVLASANTTRDNRRTKEKMMTRVRRRPLLAVALAAVILAVLTPVAYAVVDRLFLSFDPDDSEEEIERDVTEQLEAAGIESSVVQAEKSGGQLKLSIKNQNPGHEGPLRDLEIAVRGDHDGPVEQHQMRMQIEVTCELTPEQQAALTETVSSGPFVDLLGKRADGTSDAEVAAAMRAILAERGFSDVEIRVDGDAINVVVTAPPR